MTPAKARTGTGKITSDWEVLNLLPIADGFILALKNFCRDGKSHHGDFALGDADFLETSIGMLSTVGAIFFIVKVVYYPCRSSYTRSRSPTISKEQLIKFFIVILCEVI